MHRPLVRNQGASVFVPDPAYSSGPAGGGLWTLTRATTPGRVLGR